MKFPALLLALALAPGCASAFLGTTVKVGARDAETGEPLAGTFVVVREFADVGKLHGSNTYCVRAGAGVIDSAAARIDVPGPGSDALHTARAFEALAYRPGYCMARIGNAPAAARHKRVSMGMAAPPALDPSPEARFEMRRATQSPVERLIHLERVAAGLMCHESRWGRGSPEALDRLAEAMKAEAASLSGSRYEKVLAAKVATRLDAARQMPRFEGPNPIAGIAVQGQQVGGFARDFVLVRGDARVLWNQENPGVVGIATARAHAAASHAATGAVHVTSSAHAQPPLGITIHCRHGALSACDLNERNAAGETALWSYARAAKVDEVKALLQAGADPNLSKHPGGGTPIEVAIGQVIANSENAQRAIAIVDLLAADPRTTLHAPLREDLAADPSTWKQVTASPARERLAQRREQLARLPARIAAKPACEDPGMDYGYGFEYEEPPPRLRSPTGAYR